MTRIEQEVHSRLRDISPWVTSLASGDSDDFRSDERERRLRQDSPPGKETTLVPRNAVELGKRARMLPVTEAEAVMVRTATKIEDDTEDDEASNRQHLNGGENELGFAVSTCITVSTD